MGRRHFTGAQVIAKPRNEPSSGWFDRPAPGAEGRHRHAEVAVYDAPEINAFATGASRNNALVAVSTGLLRAMNRDEAEEPCSATR